MSVKYVIDYTIKEIKRDWGSIHNQHEIEYFADQQLAFNRYMELLRNAIYLDICKIQMYKETINIVMLAQQSILK